MKINRESVMLAETLNLENINGFSLGNWFMSEKLDGMRALWLPDTRNIVIGKLPFANLDKDNRIVPTKSKLATGLWSRYFRPIWAPNQWLDQLPKDMCLDGELYSGKGNFQELMSIVKKAQENSDIVSWMTKVKYCVFDSPGWKAVYSDGKIKNSQLEKRLQGVYEYMLENVSFDYRSLDMSNLVFEQTLNNRLNKLKEGVVNLHSQVQLPWRHIDAMTAIKDNLNNVLANQGEGLILRAPHSQWEPKRSKLLLKVKGVLDSEGIIVGHNLGQGRLEGMIGSLIVSSTFLGKQITFNLSGMTDQERNLGNLDSLFKVGNSVNFIYRELTLEGIPKEARFNRPFEI